MSEFEGEPLVMNKSESLCEKLFLKIFRLTAYIGRFEYIRKGIRSVKTG